MSQTKFFSSSMGKVAYTDTGGNQPGLIFIHGLPTSKEIWQPVLDHLPENQRKITFDLLDYGESEKIGRHITHKERADVLDELRIHLGMESFVLVAHDLGSSVAIDYLGKYARHVEKLILMSPPVYPDFVEPLIVKLVRIPGLGEVMVRLFKGVLLKVGILQGMLHKDRLIPDVYQAIARGFGGADGDASLLRILRWGRPFDVFSDYPRIIESIKVPTLVIQGRRDPYIPSSQVIRLRDAISGCKLVFINGGAHFLPLDTPDEVAGEINSFLSNYNAPGHKLRFPPTKKRNLCIG